jgi:hypothetical protein
MAILGRYRLFQVLGLMQKSHCIEDNILGLVVEGIPRMNNGEDVELFQRFASMWIVGCAPKLGHMGCWLCTPES